MFKLFYVSLLNFVFLTAQQSLFTEKFFKFTKQIIDREKVRVFILLKL